MGARTKAGVFKSPNTSNVITRQSDSRLHNIYSERAGQPQSQPFRQSVYWCIGIKQFNIIIYFHILLVYEPELGIAQNQLPENVKKLGTK